MPNLTQTNHSKRLKKALQKRADLIAASWRRAAASIIETGDLLNQAEKELPPIEFRELRHYLIEKAGISQTVISKLKTIARNPVLLDPHYHGNLPPSYATLYKISKIGDATLKEALEEGQITPDSQLRDIEAKFNKRKKTQKSDTVDVIVTIKGELSNEQNAHLKICIENMEKKLRVSKVGFKK